MMQVPGVGAFVRSVLPIRLSGGFSVQFGVWLLVHPDDLKRAFEIWWDDQYPTLVLEGWLANNLPHFGLEGAPAEARVLDENVLPYVVDSSDEPLSRVLNQEWPHEQLLAELSQRP
jgi:hypothetical protein